MRSAIKHVNPCIVVKFIFILLVCTTSHSCHCEVSLFLPRGCVYNDAGIIILYCLRTSRLGRIVYRAFEYIFKYHVAMETKFSKINAIAVYLDAYKLAIYINSVIVKYYAFLPLHKKLT